MPFSEADQAAVARTVAILGASDSPEAQNILNQLSPEERQGVEARLLRNQGIADTFSRIGQVITSDPLEDDVRAGLSRLGGFLSNAAKTILTSEPVQQARRDIAEAGEDLSAIGDQVTQAISNTRQAVQEQTNPLAAAQAQLERQALAEAQSVEAARFLQNEAAGVPLPVSPSVASNQLIDDPLALPITAEEIQNSITADAGFPNAIPFTQFPFEDLTQPFLQAANEQGQAVANRENLRRLGDAIALQTPPSVAQNILGNGAAAFQAPTVTTAPASLTAGVPLAQSIAGTTQVPSVLPAVRANINQRIRAGQLTDQSEASLREQQLRQLRLAEQQFQDRIIRPILRRSR